MKKNLTKLLALMMALALVFSLAACGDKTEEQSTNPSENPAVAESGNDDVTLDPADPDAMTSSEDASADASNETPSENVTTPDGGKVTNPDSGKTTPAASADKGLNSTDKAEIIKFYQAAANKSAKTKKVQKLTLASLEGGSGFVGGVINTFKGIAQSALEKNSQESQGVPGGFSKLVASDLASASAKSDGKYTTIKMTPKEQTDQPKSQWDKGPVGHAIGVLGDIDNALSQLSGVTVDYQGSGKTLTLTYKKPFVNVKIDNNTGKIVSGSWGYDVHIKIDNVTARVIGVPLTLKGASGVVNQRITMPA
ncbi:MAG: hypothetical protein SPF51_07185 [Candidatus Fimivicinus sp.]|nr:hypothetical protein [Oscillospiraceae bacterium]MDY5591313.1 hypothetical protein [Candidatus Fimivicinus sp.]